MLAHAGVASRRASEDLIVAGRVSVDGVVVRELGTRVLPDQRIDVDGRPVGREERLIYLALHKPPGYVSTARDPQGRPTVLDLVPAAGRVYPVGRLDWDSEGLLLLTNDGDLAHRLTHPSFGVEKEYHALVDGHLNQLTLRRLAAGVDLDDGPTAPARVRRLRPAETGDWLAVTIHEGRNRQVRRMLDAVGHSARRLIRARFGPIELANLPVGATRPLSTHELEQLRRATGAPAERRPAPAS